MNVVSRLSLESVFSFFIKDVDKFCNSLAELYSNISKVSSTKYRVLHWVSLCLGSGFRIYCTKILFVPGSTFIYIIFFSSDWQLYLPAFLSFLITTIYSLYLT